MAMRLLLAFFFFVFGSVCAQELNNPNKLKPCPEDQNVRYHDCWGTYTVSNGDRYVGEFKNDKKHGQGTYYYLAENEWKGDKYVGEYKDDKRNGQGTYTFANGNKYVGEFKDDKFHGQGTYYSLAENEWKGDKYVGEYKDDKRNGQGTYYYLAENQWKGDKYVGEFKDDKMNGQGTYYHLAENQWKGDKYVGEYKDGKRNGLGTYYHLAENQRKGDRYVGEYKDGVPIGEAVYLFSDGSKYIGEYERGKQNGKGIRIRADGSVYESGFYKDDKLVDSFKVDPLSFTRIPRQYLVAERKSTNTQPPAPVVTNQIDEDATQTDNPSLPTDNRRRFALVIGNANYSSLPKLQNSVNDARLITQSLRSAGFQVSTYENLDMGGMQNAIRAFGDRLGKTDVGLFYYAGHAVQVKGKNYLIPVKENIKKSFEVPSSAVDVDLVLATLEHIKNDLNIVVLDACRSSFPGEARGTNQGLASIEAAKGTFIAFATAPGKEALDGDGTNSPYSKHLARLIGKKGLPLEQVFKEVRKAVVAETRGSQVPWENSSLMGDFYFKK